MDLRFLDARPTDDERDAVDAVLGPAPTGWTGGARTLADTRSARADRSRRDLLLPALHALNGRVGWISQGGLNYVCQRLVVAPADAYGVASFYGLFSLSPRAPRVVHVCEDIACLAAGAADVLAALPDGDDRAIWVRSPCLGLCERAPAALVSEAGAEPYEAPLAPCDAAAVRAALGGTRPAPVDVVASVPQAGDSSLVLLRRVGHADPGSLDDYVAQGGLSALRHALQIGGAAVIDEVAASGLVGRGGAAFPAARKWSAVAGQPARPRFLVCNADESEPGTFKDRVLLEGDPYAVLEAMVIAGFATGCELGYVYLRGEYPVAWERLHHAVGQMRRRGILGDDVLGSGVRFDVELRRGAGAYICGEETAIFNSIEGQRGEPRNKPPFPVEVGLFGQPTLVNNVETLVNVLPLLASGGAAYAATGTAQSTGTKLFCLSGHVRRPGVYEVPFGVTLRELLRLGGGVPGGRPVRAVLLGGAAGSFVGPDELDVPLTFEGTRAIGASLGSGVVMVFDDTTDLVAIVARIAAFFRDESCGQCVPCRVGTVRVHELVQRLTSGPTAEDLSLLSDLGQAMRDASICGLGQTAANAVESGVRRLGVFAS
jgi:NADH-quinone oxidoreductase subunit F